MQNHREVVKARRRFGLCTHRIAAGMGLSNQAVYKAENQQEYSRADEYRAEVVAQLEEIRDAINATMEVTR